MGELVRFPLEAAWKSFSGVPLRGQNAVRFLYLDETGVGGEWNMVVAGPLVHADKQLVQAEKAIDFLRRRHIRKRHREELVFHATEIFNGGKIFKRVPKKHYGPAEYSFEQRLAIADDLARIPANLNIPFVARSLVLEGLEELQRPHLSSGKMTKKEVQAGPHAAVYVRALLDADLWLKERAPDEVCTVVAEDTDRKEFLKRAQQTHQDHVAMSELGDPHAALHHIRHDPLFEAKSKRSLLQLADFICYVFRKVAAGDERFLRWWEPMSAAHIDIIGPQEMARRQAEGNPRFPKSIIINAVNSRRRKRSDS